MGFPASTFCQYRTEYPWVCTLAARLVHTAKVATAGGRHVLNGFDLFVLSARNATYVSIAWPSSCFSAWTYAVRAWRPVAVMR